MTNAFRATVLAVLTLVIAGCATSPMPLDPEAQVPDAKEARQ